MSAPLNLGKISLFGQEVSVLLVNGERTLSWEDFDKVGDAVKAGALDDDRYAGHGITFLSLTRSLVARCKIHAEKMREEGHYTTESVLSQAADALLASAQSEAA